jgi:hypothetical protein
MWKLDVSKKIFVEKKHMVKITKVKVQWQVNENGGSKFLDPKYYIYILLRPCLTGLVTLLFITLNVWTHAWNIIYRLFIKIKIQLENSLWDKFFKPN